MAIVLLLACATAAAAQSTLIRAAVVDDRTGLPIAQVLISVANDVALVQPLDDGVFAITVAPGTKTLVTSAIGYAIARTTVDAPAGQVTPVTIRLSEGAGAYTEHVDVVGSADAAGRDAAAGGMALFGRDLQNLRGAILDDPLRAVQSMPAAAATDDFYSEFSVRGSSFRHINLTVDGISSKYLMHTLNDIVDGGSVTMVNSETLGAIELLPGSYAQKSGRHIGAEVNLRTREGSRDRFRGRAGLSGTSATFVGEGPLARGRGSWLASARRSYLDYLITRIDPNAAFAFGFIDAQARIGYDLTAAHHVEFTMLLGRAAFDGDGESDGVNDTASARSHTWLSSLGWSFARRRLALANRAYSTGLEFDNRNPFAASLDRARFSHLGWRVDGGWGLGAGALVEFGADAQRMTGRHTRRAAPPNASALVTAGDYGAGAEAASAYAQVRLAIGRISITPGARIDYWSLTHASTASPWLQLRISAAPRTTITAGTGIYRQFADFDQVFGLNGGGSRLSPERAVHVDAGLEQELSATTRIQLTAFVRKESKVLWPAGSELRLVNGRIAGGAFDAKWTNALDGDAHGAEIVLRRDASSGLSGWAGYAYAEARYQRAAGAETFWANADQRHTVALYGSYRLSSRTGLSAKYRFGSNFPVAGYLTTAAAAPVDPDTGGPAYYQLTGVRNTIRLRPYSRLDVRGDRAFTWGARRVVLFVEVANVLNRKNLRNTPYRVDRSGRAFGVTETMMPIIPSAGFVVEF